MPVQVNWDTNHPNIVMTTYQGNWTWDDFYKIADQATEMIRSVDHPVFIIADMRQSNGIPSGTAFVHANHVINHYPENWAGLIMVTPKGFIQAMVSMFLKVFKTDLTRKIYQARDMGDAYRYAIEWRAASK